MNKDGLIPENTPTVNNIVKIKYIFIILTNHQ